MKKHIISTLFLYAVCADFFLIATAEIPVIFIHKSNSYYLKDSLWQAKQFNKRVILLGDETNNKYPDIEYYNMQDYSEGAKYFASIYQNFAPDYVYDYHLLCFQRWFILRDFAKAHNITKCFYCDSDIMLYCDVTEEQKRFATSNFALLIHFEGGGASGHTSYWNSQKSLEDFCSFLIKSYTSPAKMEEWKNLYLQEYIKNGWAISDMTALNEFGINEWSKDKKSVVNLESIENNTTYDVNMNEDEQYSIYTIMKNQALGSSIKDITWINHLPHCYNKQLSKMVQFKSLHFQGPAKSLMNQYKMEKSK